MKKILDPAIGFVEKGINAGKLRGDSWPKWLTKAKEVAAFSFTEADAELGMLRRAVDASVRSSEHYDSCKVCERGDDCDEYEGLVNSERDLMGRASQGTPYARRFLDDFKKTTIELRNIRGDVNGNRDEWNKAGENESHANRGTRLTDSLVAFCGWAIKHLESLSAKEASSLLKHIRSARSTIREAGYGPACIIPHDDKVDGVKKA